MPEEVVDTAQRTVRLFILHQMPSVQSQIPRKKSDLPLDWINKLSNLEIGFLGEWLRVEGEKI